MVVIENNKKYGIILLALSFLPSPVCAEPSLIIRPQAGYGYLDSSAFNNRGGIYHAGARILLNAGETRLYGLEVSRFDLDNGDNFISLGIVLEQKLWDWFNMSIGTVGYFGYGVDSKNPIGLMTNLGWEPRSNNAFKPFITYRNDIIFSDKTDIAHSISAGFTLEF